MVTQAAVALASWAACLQSALNQGKGSLREPLGGTGRVVDQAACG